MKRRALVVAPFYSGSVSWSRPDRMAQALSSFVPVDIVTADFDHSSKQKKSAGQGISGGDITHIATIPYYHNVGMMRFISHICFGISAVAHYWRNRNRWDVVYVTVPINVAALLIFALAKPGTLKIVDVVDIWPDVLPFSARMRQWLAPLLWAWKLLFRGAVAQADVLLTVSDSFLFEAQLFNRKAASKRFYLGHEVLASGNVEESIFTISYIGNIGHLYDFESLLEVCSQPRFLGRTQIFIIGEGDRRQWLTSELSTRGIPHQYFGTVYDSKTVADILNRSHVGFNGYINTTASFSYKAATYFAAGLPILNSMPGDLERLVRDRRVGVNYTQGDASSLATALGSAMQDKGLSMKAKVKLFFNAELEASVVKSQINEFLARFFVDEELASHPSHRIEQPPSGHTNMNSPDKNIAKRSMDLIITLLFVPVLLPILAIVALLVRLFLGSPAIFAQTRPGRNGAPFKLYKFRTMTQEKDTEGNLLADEKRLTRFGRFLRASSLDELPELWNVLRGEMSLVGPRPLLVEYLDRYSTEQMRRHDVMPGITGWAQVNGRNAISWDEKLKLDVWYVDNQSIWLDFKILFLTVYKVFRSEGIAQQGHVTSGPFLGSKTSSTEKEEIRSGN